MRPAKSTYSFLFALILLSYAGQVKAQIQLKYAGRFSTGFYDRGAAEISAFDNQSKRLFVTSGADTSLRIVNISNPSNPVQIARVSIAPYGIDLTSVAARNGLIAVSVIDSAGKTANCKVVFFDPNGNFLSQVRVGANPDMVVFTPDGKKLLVANEGEPNSDYTIDREGSVSIINLAGGAASLTQANVQTAGFTQFNTQTLDARIRITGKIQSGGSFLRNSTVAEDLEPEYITISDDGKTAWVTCQENNCIATLNIDNAVITSLSALGYKNHNLSGNGLDASDQSSGVNIANYPVFGMYMPDAIAHYKVGNTTYLLTANEGDARADWGAANNEEIRVGSSSYVLDTVKFGGAANVAALKANTSLGRLNVSRNWGDFNNDGRYDSIFCFGARSFSIWNASTGALVWDSKDELEQRTLAAYPNFFNVSSTNNTFKNRSDDKGPETEAVTVARIFDSTYAFVGLERIGGIMVYNVTNPNAPYFVQYINTRNFSVTPSLANLSSVGDLSVEGLIFIPRHQSPTGKDLVVASHEISGTVAVFEVTTRSAFQMQVLHSSDMESGLDATTDAPNYAAILDKLEDEHTNTLILSSGDNYIPGPFLFSGEDAALQTPLRNTATSYFSGATSGLRAALGRADIAMMNIMGFNASVFGNHEFDLGTAEINSMIGVDIRSSGADKRWIGAQFPYLSANLNFSNDASISYLYTAQRLQDTAFRTNPNITANAQKRGIAPSTIIVRNGERIGVVGATTQILAKISSPGATTITGPQVDDMPALAAILQPTIDSLRFAEGINKIVLLAHLQQLANEEALAGLLKGVDIIIAGGSHTVCADANDRLRAGMPATRTYPILKTDADGQPIALLNMASEWKYLGRFVCDFDSTGRLITSTLDNTINGAYATDSAGVTALYGTYADGFVTGSKGALVRQLTTATHNVITAKDGLLFGKSNVFLEGRRNAVRTEETNLGNVSSDANLWMARRYDPAVKISIKNGGGIRSAVGEVFAVGSNVQLLPTAPNTSAGKNRGDISRLDIENSLRFNNRLSIVSVNAAGLKRLIEHGISTTRPGATPGQFPQVGGLAFSYDTTKATGNKLWSMVTIDSLGNRMDTIVRNGVLYGDTSKIYKVVTLDFLAGGGDGYPFVANSFNRVNLDTAVKDSMVARFAGNGTEQDAFAEFMLARHTAIPYNVRDTSIVGDKRIQLLNAREDDIFPETNPAITIAQARSLAAPKLVRTRGVITRAWGRFIYIQDATGAIGVRQASGAMVDAITNGTLTEGDSVEVIGPRNEFNNYAQIQLNSGAYTGANTVIKLASGIAVVPVDVTIKQLNESGEQFESRLIRLTKLETSVAGQFTASTNYTVWKKGNQADVITLRVISAADTEIDDAPALRIPNGTFTFEGVLAQFCSSPANACTTGYQLYAVRKKDVAADLSAYQLATPVNNARVETQQNGTASVRFHWENGNGTSYKWMLTGINGTYSNPLLVAVSDNSAKDTLYSTTTGALDQWLASQGLTKGDSIQVRWTAFAYLKGDSLKAATNNLIWLVRQREVRNFSLLTPPNNARIEVQNGDNTNLSVTWQNAGPAARYVWLLDIPTGNFGNPLVRFNSDNNGLATQLTLVSGNVSTLLGTLGVAQGDSINLKWTVRAIDGTVDSIQATQSFNVKFVRKVGFVGLSEQTQQHLVVYPNPFREELHIVTATDEAIAFEVYDLRGAVMLKGNLQKEVKVNTSSLKPGVYFLKTSTTQGSSVHKVVKE
jgi:2',3'-cyclic-nucleotide 2'-phosphodiesterase (5'-nucleotidase family)